MSCFKTKGLGDDANSFMAEAHIVSALGIFRSLFVLLVTMEKERSESE